VLGVRTRLVREGAVWFVLPGVGLKRANEDETMELVHSGFVSIKRKNVKNQRYLSSVDYAGLNNDQKREFNWLASVAGVLRLFVSRRVQKRLKTEVESSQSEMDPKRVLGLFGE
jgi:hypothetical protein